MAPADLDEAGALSAADVQVVQRNQTQGQVWRPGVLQFGDDLKKAETQKARL